MQKLGLWTYHICMVSYGTSWPAPKMTNDWSGIIIWKIYYKYWQTTVLTVDSVLLDFCLSLWAFSCMQYGKLANKCWFSSFLYCFLNQSIWKPFTSRLVLRQVVRSCISQICSHNKGAVKLLSNTDESFKNTLYYILVPTLHYGHSFNNMMRFNTQ